jgi:hypothetical protein
MRVRALSATGDFTWGQGGGNYLVDSPAAVGQLVETTLQMWQGEWFLDTLYGTPWLQQILGQFGAKSVVDIIIQSVILSTQPAGCVTQIVEYSSTLSGRALTVQATIDTQFSAAGQSTTVINVEI